MSQIIYNLAAIGLALVFLAAAYVSGAFVLRRTGWAGKIKPAWRAPLAALLGYGLIILASLLLAACGPINRYIGYALLLLVLVLGRSDLLAGLKQIAAAGAHIKKYSTGEKILSAGLVLCGLFYLTSALVPPYRTDALAYHLPEAMGVAARGLGFLVKSAPGNFFTNLPAGVEVMDAALYALGGFTLIHLLHYSILLACLFFLFRFLEEYFDRARALLAVLLIFSLYDLFVNGTNAYIDAVMIAWELSGWLLLLSWTESRETAYLILAGIFYGLALGTKYNALYGLLLAGAVLLFYLVKDRSQVRRLAKPILCFGLPIILVSGFWYLKNLIFYGNPVYPFYFGHPGFTDASYQQLTTAVKSFIVDRTLLNFLRLPFIFFLNSYYIVLFSAFISWPLVFFRKLEAGQRRIVWISSGYIGAYSVLWFFFITHQAKFFYGPMILLLVILALQLDLAGRAILKRCDRRLVWIAAVLIMAALAYKMATAKDDYFLQVKAADLAYVFGFHDAARFYQDKGLGGIYQASRYINDNFRDTVWLNVWGATDFFLSAGNRFAYDPDLIYNDGAASAGALRDYLRKNGISKAVIDDVSEQRAQTDALLSQVCQHDPSCSYYRQRDEATAGFIENSASPVYDQAGIRLYDLTSDR